MQGWGEGKLSYLLRKGIENEKSFYVVENAHKTFCIVQSTGAG